LAAKAAPAFWAHPRRLRSFAATAAADKSLRNSANLHFAVLDDLARLAGLGCIKKLLYIDTALTPKIH
jgi:hypothetical protein